jgi:hypothetical protein
METIPHTPPIATDDGFDDGPEPRVDFSPEERAAAAIEFARLVAEAGPVLNLHGERLDQLTPLTLTDELDEIAEAVADGVCSSAWARSARQNVLDRHRVDPRPPAGHEGEPGPEPGHAESERAIETSGADPPAIEAVVERLAALMADDDLIAEDSPQLGKAVMAATFDRSSAVGRTVGLGPDDVERLVAEVDWAVFDDPQRWIERRRPRAERRLAGLVAEMTDAGPDDDIYGYFLLCADAGEALAAAVDRLSRHRAIEQAEADEAERRARRQEERAARRAAHPRRPVEAEPMELVRPHAEVDDGPSEAQREELALALALAAIATPAESYAAMALVREAAVAARDDDTAAWARSKLRQLRRTVA